MDLILAASMLVAATGIALQLGLRIGKRFGAQCPGITQATFAAGILLSVWFAWTLGADLRLATYVPHGCVLLLSNGMVILAVASAGILVGSRALSRAPLGRTKEILFACGLCSASVGLLSFAILRPALDPIELAEQSSWEQGVCLQTHESSCAAAAAATLLRQHRISASEREMASACLTSASGTMVLGTYRGLFVASRPSGLLPKACIDPPDSATAASLIKRLPLIAHVEMQKAIRGSSTSRRYGASGDGHCVVVLDHLPNGNWLVADPAVGRVVWPDAYFRNVWNGESIHLE